jgi:assimilatory nitrate reductase catalytic subunit
MQRGEIRGVIGLCNNAMVSIPNHAMTVSAYDALEFHAQGDIFLSETTARADVVLPCAAWAEDDGTHTNAEGRVVKLNKAAEPPGEARPDWWIMCEIAKRLGAGDKFAFDRAGAVFDELRVASRGGVADYYGVSFEDLDEEMGVFWPCPEPGHPGTPRLFEDRRSYLPDGRFRFKPVEWRPPAEETDTEFPLWLTTGRTVAHYLSGNQTRRIAALVEQAPRPWVEVHPSLGFAADDPVRVVTRRGAVTLPALVSETIRPDTVFIPYHWGAPSAANILTLDALDPLSRIPEFKSCACKVERGDRVDAVAPPPVLPERTRHHDEPVRADRAPAASQGRGTADS